MSAEDWYWAGLAVMAAWTVVTVVILQRLKAPYGRHTRGGWGPTMPARWGWVVFESPAVLLFVPVFLAGSRGEGSAPAVLLGLWLLHYVHRAFIWPFRMRGGHKPMPLAVVGAAVAFQLVNSWLNASWLGDLGVYPPGWLTDPRFVAGVALFLGGFAINQWADLVLFRLRAPGETGYKIPRGGLYERVSCPNYLGELLEWTGWALASWSWAGAAFAVYTAANLVPRAVDHHRWYHDTFPDYPEGRRAILPWLL